MAHIDGINIHHAHEAIAKAKECNGTTWLSLEFSEDDGIKYRRFRVDIFMDYARADRVAEAINAAWPEPEAVDDQVLTWERPAYHGRGASRLPDTGLHSGCGLKMVSPPTLMDDDGPDSAA